MKISNMAIKNVKGNLYRYIMYCLSNAFAVTAFFIFANFVFHPSIDFHPEGVHAVASMGAANGMKISQVIIIIFSFLFVGYSTSIFLKSRGKEFGLLSLYGMTRKQIKKYVFIESTILSLLSIGTGIITGLVFSKLFFMIMESLLDISIPFNISLKALGLTFILFFLLFEIISVFMLSQIKGKEIIEQIKSSKIPKITPEFSKRKAILGIVLMIIGYTTAWFVTGAFVVLGMIPVTLIVIAGTYFLFTQFSIAVANKILKNENILYKKSNLVSYSQMIFKLQDTAKVLFLASILGAITFTATETIFSFYTELPANIGLDSYADIVIAQEGENLDDTNSLDKIKKILEKDGLKIEETTRIKVIKVMGKPLEAEGVEESEAVIISNSDYNKMAASQDKETVTVKEGEIIYNFPYIRYDADGSINTDKQFSFDKVLLSLNDYKREYNVSEKEIHGEILSLKRVGYYDMFILNDKDFQNELNSAKEKDLVLYNGIKLDKWRKSYNSSMEIDKILGSKYEGKYFSKIFPYKEVSKVYGLILFIGFFIAFLFFIASGSIIYFKLFNEIKQDSIEYNILKKIGATNKEINKIITKQIGIIFFLPFVVSTSHSLFALKSLSNLLRTNLFTNGIIVMFGYLVFQLIYFLVIRKVYINKIRYN